MIEIIESRLRSLIGSLFRAEGLLRGPQIVRELAEIGSDFRLGIRIGSVTAPEPIGGTLEARLKIVLIDAAERVAKLGCGGVLISGHLTRGLAHLLFELRKPVGKFLSILRELLGLLPEALPVLAGLGLFGLALADATLLQEAAELAGLTLLFVGELVSLTGHLIDAAGILLALHAAEGAHGIAEAVGRAARVGCALLLGSGAIEGVRGLAERIDGVLHAGIVCAALRLSGLSCLRGLVLRLTLARLALT